MPFSSSVSLTGGKIGGGSGTVIGEGCGLIEGDVAAGK